MEVKIGELYHWSPRKRRKQIVRHGLRPHMIPTVSLIEDEDWRPPYICLGTTPMLAWQLSGGLRRDNLPHGPWDLWEITPAGNDEFKIRTDWGPDIIEVRCLNRIPKRRVAWIGERER